MRVHRRWAAGAAAGAAVAMVLSVAPRLTVAGTGTTEPAALAGRMSGRWKLNPELSRGFVKPDRAREGRRGTAASLGLVPVGLQRGGRGRGGGGGDAGGYVPPEVVPAEAAAQRALAMVQQVPLELTIDATPGEVRFIEPRGQSVFLIDGKNAAVEVPGGVIKVKSKWDSSALRQEFSSTQRMLRKAWSVDSNDHLVLIQRVESLAFTSRDARAVFDRQ